LAYSFAADSMGLSSFKFVQCVQKGAPFLQQSAHSTFKVVQGHPTSIILVQMESACAT